MINPRSLLRMRRNEAAWMDPRFEYKAHTEIYRNWVTEVLTMLGDDGYFGGC